MRQHWRRLGGVAVGLAIAGCTNNPYPDADAERKIVYGAFNDAPRSLDPAFAYTTISHAITGLVYETLLEYHYLKRPFEQIPALAEAVPEAEERPDGRVAYRFRLRPGVYYQDDPSFALGGAGRKTREVVAADVAFELMRVADPAVNSPVTEPFSNLLDFNEFRERLSKRREAEPAILELPAHEQYEAVGVMQGARVLGSHELEIVLRQPYPQILYWFCMPFTAPVPWEAVQYYDGDEGRPRFADHPVGAGPYYLVEYEKEFRITLEKNENWYGVMYPERKAPGAVYPSEGEPEDLAGGRLDPAYVGRPLPFVERIELRRDKESIPRFNKFLQGYYDSAAVINESFDKVVVEDRISPEMAALGIELEKSVRPSVFYLGFNMDDPVVGRADGERSRKLRQAMSMVVDTDEWLRLFVNGRGVPAQTPIPPGLYGYEESYRNPYRQVDLAKARALMAEAGYPKGIDPKTGKPLKLTFDIYQANTQQLIQNRFFVNAWRDLGIDVEMDVTSYNQFQEKVRKGAYQLFFWGWVADYPDPENFYFLLWSEMARSKNNGPNSSNFSNPEFDALFLEMKTRDNDEQRMALIRRMREILERERPWIELFHSEDYSLHHVWLKNVKPFGMSFPMTKYHDVDAERRSELRTAWNRPVTWPAWALGGLLVVLVVPGIFTFLRERQ